MFSFDITTQFVLVNTDNAVTISSFSLSIGTTVLSTVIIAIRILMVSHLPGTSHQPRIAMEIIVESAALYSISAIVYTPMIGNSAAATYAMYAEIFFAYVAVESHPLCPPVPIF
jgi:hypothetical protein